MDEFHNEGQKPLTVPGFGLPIDYDPFEWPNHGFRHGCSNHFSFQRLTVRELAMLRFMDAITDKPDWESKIFTDEITRKWKHEAFEQSNSMINDDVFTWLMAELQQKASEHKTSRIIKALDTESRVLKSHTLIESELQQQLLDCVAPMLRDPNKDWHPNSNEQVLNLVHPSLYPLVYGRTRVLKTGQVSREDSFAVDVTTEIAPGGQEVDATRKGRGYISNIDNAGLWSTNFQWLPCDIAFSGDSGTDVRIESYINNLHPVKNKALYDVVERFITKSIPLWNSVLFRDFYGRTPLRIKANSAEFMPPQPTEWPMAWEEAGSAKNEKLMEELKQYWAQPDNPTFVEQDPDDEWAHPPKNWTDMLHDGTDLQDTVWTPWHLGENKWYRTRKVLHPMPAETFESWKSKHNGDNENVRLEEEFRDRGLQVIVKLASIELTLEKPTYEGGSWHLEGMQNEHIVATSIYYFDVKNTTTARIRFRQSADLDGMMMQYEQDDHGPLAEIFGTESLRDEPALQDIGSVATPEGRIIAFPNTLQHRVEPFELEDKTRPGHRRFLVLWLVDPHFRIVSTANVPPQQREWWEAEGLDLDDLKGFKVQDLMTEEKAKSYRVELMKERTTFAETIDANTDTYNFCEH